MTNATSLPSAPDTEEFVEDELTPEERLVEVNKLKYKDQAIWFLNSTDHGENESDRERTYNIYRKCVELDARKEDGSSLDKFSTHRVLEFCSRAFTVQDLKRRLVCADDRRASLAELLLFTFDVDLREVLSRSNDLADRRARAEAERRLEEAKKAIEEAVRAAAAATENAAAARRAEEAAVERQNESRSLAEASRVAEAASAEAGERLRRALEETETRERANQERRERLERYANDDNLGIVRRNKARAELAVMDNEDPLPLRTARLSGEACLKKSQKAAELAGVAATAAENALEKAEEAEETARRKRAEALETGRLAEASIPPAVEAQDEVYAFLEELIAKHDAGKGTLFFLEKELEITKKSLPKSKFGAVEKAAQERSTPAKRLEMRGITKSITTTNKTPTIRTL